MKKIHPNLTPTLSELIDAAPVTPELLIGNFKNSDGMFQDNNFGGAMPPIAPPTIANWAQHAPLGCYITGALVRYAVSFVSNKGEESELGPWGNWTLIDNNAVAMLENIPVDQTYYQDSNYQTVQRNIYRETVLPSQFESVGVNIDPILCATIQDNETTTFNEETIGPPAPPLDSISSLTKWVHDQPLGSWVKGNQVQYAITFVSQQNAEEAESELGPWSQFFDIGSYANATLNDIPVDTTVYSMDIYKTIKRNIYRRFNLLQSDGSFIQTAAELVGSTADNIVTTFIDNNIGSPMPPTIALTSNYSAQKTPLGYWAKGNTYSYGVSFVNSDGGESLISWMLFQEINEEALYHLENVPVDSTQNSLPSADTCQRNIYRQFAILIDGGLVPQDATLIGSIYDNVTTEFQDNDVSPPMPPTATIGDLHFAQYTPLGTFVTGNQVRYAVSYINEIGEESAIGSWTDWTQVTTYALPKFTVPQDTVVNTLPAANTASQNIYRQFSLTGPSSINSQSNWAQIKASLMDASGNSYVLNATSDVDGASVVLAPESLATESSFWQYLPNGQIANRQLGGLVLAVNSASELELQIQQNPIPAQQNWVFLPSTRQLINSNNNAVVQIAPDAEGLFTPAAGTTVNCMTDISLGIANQWYLSPSNPLETILQLSQTGFIQFTSNSGQQTAFEAICTQLVSGNNLRDYYTSTDEDFDILYTKLSNMSAPSGVSQSDWAYVQAQIEAELQAAGSINLLFTNWNDYCDKLFTSENTVLNGAIQLVGLSSDSSNNCCGTIISLLEGILYTVMEANPETAVLGNIMMAAANIGMATSVISDQPFETDVASLWQTLQSNFQGLSTATATTQTTILSNWGMMNETAACILELSGPSSLAWPSTLTPELLAASVPGYTNAVLKILMPADVWVILYGESIPTIDVPSYAVYTDSNGVDYIIAQYFDDGTYVNFPSEELMAVVETLGSTNELFLGLNGWSMQRVEYIGSGGGDGRLGITVTNQTNNALMVTMEMVNGNNIGPSSVSMPVFSSAVFAADNSFEVVTPEVNISIFDDSISSSKPVASFTVTMSEVYTTTVTNQSSNNGYSLFEPAIISKNLLLYGLVQISLYQD